MASTHSTAMKKVLSSQNLSKQQGIFPAVDWSEFSNWCFLKKDLMKANLAISVMHESDRLHEHGWHGEAVMLSLGKGVHERMTAIGERMTGKKGVDHHMYAQFTAGALGKIL